MTLNQPLQRSKLNPSPAMTNSLECSVSLSMAVAPLLIWIRPFRISALQWSIHCRPFQLHCSCFYSLDSGHKLNKKNDISRNSFSIRQLRCPSNRLTDKTDQRTRILVDNPSFGMNECWNHRNNTRRRRRRRRRARGWRQWWFCVWRCVKIPHVALLPSILW